MGGIRRISKNFRVASLAMLCCALAVVGLPATADAADEFSPSSDVVWDVVNLDPGTRHTGPLRALIWDLEEYDGKIYAAGKFLNVLSPDGTTFDQPYLAAFDLATGVWIDTFRPDAGGILYSIAISDDGRILAGGEIPGGVAAFDAQTGARDNSFNADLSLSWGPTAVYDMEIVGSDVFVGGNFSAAEGVALRDLAKISVDTGALVSSWLPRADLDQGTPRIGGRLVYGIAVDSARDRVYVAGKFGGIDGDTNAAYLAIIDPQTGLLRTDVPQGVPPETLSHRESFSMWLHDVQFRDDKVYLGGQAHQTLILDAATLAPERSYFTNRGVGDEFAGGDTQVLYVGENTVWAGCHCWGSVGEYQLGSYIADPGGIMTYAEYREWVIDFRDVNPFGQQSVKGGFGIDITTGDLLPLTFNLGGQAGGWALVEDSNGRLWMGGQFTRDPATGRAINGLTRFSPTGQVQPGPEGLRTTRQTRERIVLNWQPVAGATEYEVLRDGSVIGTPSGVWFTDLGLEAGTEYSYTVRALTPAGPTAQSSSLTAATEGAPNVRPDTPEGLRSTLQTRERIVLNWQPVDGAATYEILRDGTVVASPSGVWYVDLGLDADTFYSYSVRAVAADGTNSAVSTPIAVSTQS